MCVCAMVLKMFGNVFTFTFFMFSVHYSRNFLVSFVFFFTFFVLNFIKCSLILFISKNVKKCMYKKAKNLNFEVSLFFFLFIYCCSYFLFTTRNVIWIFFCFLCYFFCFVSKMLWKKFIPFLFNLKISFFFVIFWKW